MEILLRPQPVGVFSAPASLLLLPSLPESNGDAIRGLLLADRFAPLPTEWEFYSQALRGETCEASPGEGRIASYNRFVFSGDPDAYRRLRDEFTGELSDMLEITAYYYGLIDTPPAAESLDGELRALALMMSASRWIEQEYPEKAMPELAAAAQLVREISPVFASHLLRQMAQLAPDRRESIDLCRDAAQLVGPCLDHRLRAEAWIHLGQICQAQAEKDRSLLVEAVRAYQQALRCGISLDCEADFFALAQNNIGLAYLAMPMTEAGDHLRTGVAIQSFREALKVYDKEKSPQLWVSTQLNLANALQYMKSSHPEENLARAVEIYEELLSMRKRAFDPIGYARLLANQANALAHLGVFAPAMEKANEAHKLFHWHNEPQLASAMLELASEINSRLDHSVQTGVR